MGHDLFFWNKYWFANRSQIDPIHWCLGLWLSKALCFSNERPIIFQDEIKSLKTLARTSGWLPRDLSHKISLRKTYTWWSPKSSYSEFYVKSSGFHGKLQQISCEIHLKTLKSSNSRKTLHFHGVQWWGCVSWFHKSATKDLQLPGMFRIIF